MKNLIAILFIVFAGKLHSQQLFEMPANTESRLSSFENPNGMKGQGGKTNKMAKGNAFEWIQPGETKMLLNVQGEGSIRRIWLTIDQDPVKLRSLRLQMFWDGSTRAAVDVPLGDFFCYNLGKQVAFESALFSSGEGRSFNCYITMPFRKGAMIRLINEGEKMVKLYYDVDFLYEKLNPQALYFHAWWNRKKTGKLRDDYVLLPEINGKGRFLGVSVGLNTDTSYGLSWWGEGEVKIYLDGDKQYPTIVGTGAEDYLGSAWGLGKFVNKYQGCTVASDSAHIFNFYRWHIPDPVYFSRQIKVTIQQIGGWGEKDVKALLQKGANLEPISVDRPEGFVRLLDMDPLPSLLKDENFPKGWVNFYRVDDYSSVSYFYLDKASSNLPGLPGVATRIENVK
jgi:hypothetical protein